MYLYSFFLKIFYQNFSDQYISLLKICRCYEMDQKGSERSLFDKLVLILFLIYFSKVDLVFNPFHNHIISSKGRWTCLRWKLLQNWIIVWYCVFIPVIWQIFFEMALIMSDVKYSLVALDHVDIYRLFFRHVLKVF